MNKKNVDYLISYDGECGDREYGQDLPKSLNCTKFLLNAGTSAQATLLGKKNVTFESLYVSAGISKIIESIPKQITLWERAV